MINIVASYNVTPNQPTPKDPLWLSDIDQVVYPGHTPTLYVYRAKHNCNAIERLRNSLSKILVFYYPVAGRLRLTKSGRMEVDCNAKGVTLLEAETTNSFGYYGDFSSSESTKELVPKVDYTRPIEELPLLLVQLTRFHGGEGLAIGVALSHQMADGASASRFFNTWAKLARGEKLEPNEIPFLDRTILKLPHQPSSQRVDQPAWKRAPQTPGVEHKKNASGWSVASLKLTSSQVERLKKKANIDQPLKEGVRPYTRFEAIAAHVWRCASKARASDEDQPTLVRFGVDIRNRLNPPLPQNYFGNALARTMTPKCYEGDIISNPLSYIAQKIREAVHVVTDEYIRSQLDSISATTLGQGNRVSVPFSRDHYIFHITSWMTMQVYEADFGWGKPVHFGSVAGVIEADKANIMLSSDGDGVVVYLNFKTAQLQLFKKFFYEDICISSL